MPQQETRALARQSRELVQQSKQLCDASRERIERGKRLSEDIAERTSTRWSPQSVRVELRKLPLPDKAVLRNGRNA